jgi:DNA-binding HxlR family transcriptional regulator
LSYRPQFLDVIGLLVRRPRTAKELFDLLPDINTDTIYSYMKQLREEGLVERKGRGVKGDPFTYHWVVWP